MTKSCVWRFAGWGFEIALALFLLSLFIGEGAFTTGLSVSAAARPPSSSLLQVAGTADLTVSKTDSPDPVVSGNNITYTINFSNAGPDAATTVQVQDPVPAGTTFISASVTSGAGWSVSTPPVGGTGVVTFSKATVANGETAMFSLVVRASSTSSISNTATVSAATGDPTPGNSTSTAGTAVALFNLCVQDDATRAILSVNTSTGTFQYLDCGKGIALSGTGAVSRDASMCKILLNSQFAKAGSGSASATINQCTMVGTAQIFLPGSSTATKLNDSNIGNNVCGCP